MNYLDIETIQLFLYLLYYEPDGNEREFYNISEFDNSPENINNFKSKIVSDICRNEMNNVFEYGKRIPKMKNNFFVTLKKPDKLMTILEDYTNKFRQGELQGNSNIFSYKNQLQYFQNEFEYLSKHYGDRFFITPVFRETDNSKESTACGLRIFDFIMFLHFHPNFYILIRDCKKIQPSDNYLYLKDKFFNIALEVELAKPVKQIFDELNQELMKEQEQALKEAKGTTIAGYTVEKIDKKGSFDHGKYRLTYKNNVREGLIHSKRKADILIFLLKKIGLNIPITDIFSESVFEGDDPIKTLETYLGELNTAFRSIFKPKGRKKYLRLENNIIKNLAP